VNRSNGRETGSRRRQTSHTQALWRGASGMFVLGLETPNMKVEGAGDAEGHASRERIPDRNVGRSGRSAEASRPHRGRL